MEPSLAGIRVLVVDDNTDTRDLLDQILRLSSATVLTASSAREAVLRTSEADIILSDVALPDEDGVWLWERVNLEPRPIPIIALTGYTAEQYPRMTQARFARTLLKPVDPEEVGKVIWEVLGGSDGAGAARPAA